MRVAQKWKGDKKDNVNPSPFPLLFFGQVVSKEMRFMGVITRALRNVSRRKIRTLLVTVALGFSMAIMMSIPASVVANQLALQGLSEDYNEIITEMEEQINKTMTLIECSLTGGFRRFMPPPFGQISAASEQYMNESAIYDISSIKGVKNVVPFLEKSVGTTQTVEVRGRSFTMFMTDYTIVGIPLNSSIIEEYAVLPTNIIDGRNLQEGDSGVVLLSLNLTQFFEAGVGDQANILGKYFTVVGVYKSTDPLGLKNLYMSLSDAQAVTSLEGKISRLNVYAEDQSYVSEIVSQITSLYPELYVTTYEQRLSQLERTKEMYQNMLANAESTLTQTQDVAFQVIVLSVSATNLIILFTMLYSVRERTREIGILKAIGFSNSSIMIQFMLEGIILSLMAGTIGVVVGVAGAPYLSSLLLPTINPFGSAGLSRRAALNPTAISPAANLSRLVAGAPDPQTLLLMFGVSVLLGALGSLYPSWRASRTSPMEALRHE
ncbi:MAG: FtsX-like permease family protein [Candidatus Bathyarchaeia archaeon]